MTNRNIVAKFAGKFNLCKVIDKNAKLYKRKMKHKDHYK